FADRDAQREIAVVRLNRDQRSAFHLRQDESVRAGSAKMRRTSNYGVLAPRAATRGRNFRAHAFLFEIFELLGDPERRESHVRDGRENIDFPEFFLLRMALGRK